MYDPKTKYRELTWKQFAHQCLTLEDSFAENAGEFESYIVKDGLLVLISDYNDDWSVINYIQLLPAELGEEACMVFQRDDAPEDPFNFNMDAKLKVRIFQEQ